MEAKRTAQAENLNPVNPSMEMKKEHDLSSQQADPADKGRSRSGQLFGTMEASKRHPESSGAADNRQSLSDQSAPKGVLGNAWDSFTKGT